MRTYRLSLIGERDGILFGFKEFEARDEAHAAQVATRLSAAAKEVIDWDGQRLICRLQPLASVEWQDR